MNLYNCKRGDLVMTGDNYRMSPCVCLRPKHRESNYSFDTVTFLRLTDGKIYESGAANSAYLDRCDDVACRLPEDELIPLVKLWEAATIFSKFMP